MMHLDWFVGTMKKTFNIEVKREDVGYEAHDFYHEEIDDLLIPVEHLEKLPNPLLIEAISYVDDKGYEWIAGYVLNAWCQALLGKSCFTRMFHTA